jgi:hypothetical protein
MGKEGGHRGFWRSWLARLKKFLARRTRRARRMGKGFGLFWPTLHVIIRTSMKRTWMVGRGSVRTGASRPSRGQRMSPYKGIVGGIATPLKTAQCRCKAIPANTSIPSPSSVRDGLLKVVAFRQERVLVGVHALSGRGREAPVRTEPRPTIRVRFNDVRMATLSD